MKELSDYQNFVIDCTSDPSKDLNALIERLIELDKIVNISALTTGSTGLASEGGEFAEIVKKCIYQGKPLDNETLFHLKRELGDIAFYWALAAYAIGETPESVLQENIKKLSARYPYGFSVDKSENRQQGDI